MTKSKSNLIKSAAGIFFALQIIGATVILSCPLPAFAQSKADSVNSLQFTPQVTIPNSNFISDASTSVGAYNSATGRMDSTLLAQYIGAIYNYGLAIAGILATIMLMAAGVIWLTSGGDSGKITQAKELISGSIAGLIILVVSWVILNTINPDLVTLKTVSTANLAKVNVSYLICCSPTTGELKYPVKIVNGKKIATNGSLIGKEIKCPSSAPGCSVGKQCIGSGNSYGCWADDYCCQCEIWPGVSGLLAHGIITCKDHLTKDACTTWCNSYLNDKYKRAYPHYNQSLLYSCTSKGTDEGQCQTVMGI